MKLLLTNHYCANFIKFPYQLLENALKNMIKTSDSLLHCIIAVHVTYTDHKAYFEWFSKLIFLVPSILSNIEKHTMQDSDIKVCMFVQKHCMYSL